MRVAAGVLLILAAVINLFASLGYLGGGAFASGVGSVSDVAIEQSMYEADETLTAEEVAAYSEVADELGNAGGMLMAMGVLLLVSVGILIAGAVFLFQSKKASFALGAGVMAIICEVLGIGISSFGIMNIIGLVGGALAIVAARSYANVAASDEDVAVA
ncbi:MAG: hypothetical protein ACR2QS_12940 [Woeseiaceae bacterium]